MKLARTIIVRTRNAVTIKDSTNEKPRRREGDWWSGRATQSMNAFY
jgi:hypothetical protein